MLVCSSSTLKTISFWLNTKLEVQTPSLLHLKLSLFSPNTLSLLVGMTRAIYMVHYYAPYGCCLLSIFMLHVIFVFYIYIYIIVYSIMSWIILFVLYIFVVLLVYCQSVMDYFFVLYIFLLHVFIYIYIYIYIYFFFKLLTYCHGY